MKKTRINLIVNREDYQKYEKYFRYLRISLIALAVIFFVTFFTFFTIIKNKSDNKERLELKKRTLLEYLKQRTNDSAKVNYIEKKYHDLSVFLEDDAYSSPYYSLLNSALNESSESAKLKSFTIDKDRAVDFTIKFTDINQLRSFFKFIESQNFLDKFESISLKSLSIYGATDVQEENYELSFTGKFIPLDKITEQNENQN